MDISILIATRNRAPSLRRTLQSLARQEVGPLTWEVVVVDNGSADETRDVLRNPPDGLPLVALHEPEPGKNRALNRALGSVSGDLLVFTDDDVVADPHWLRDLQAASTRWPEDNIFGGRIVPRFPDATRPWLSGPDFPYGRWTFGLFHPRPDEGPTHETPLGANVAFRRRVFDRDRFDDSMGPARGEYPMGSEVEFLLRLYRLGELFVYVPTAVVEHVLSPHHVEHDYLVARARRCGRGNARLFPTVGDFPLFGVPPFHLQRLVRAVIGVARTRRGSERDRWLADLTFNQVLGNVRERRRVAASPGARSFPGPGSFARLFKRRGAFGALFSPLRLLFGSIARYDAFQFFEWDVSRTPEHVHRPEGVTVEVLHGPDAGHDACAALCRFEISTPQDILARLDRGDRVAVARSGSDVLGYCWAAYSDLPITEIDQVVRVGPDLVVGYDGFVDPDARGRGVLPFLDRAQIEEARSAGRTRQLVYVSARNRASLRSMVGAGKTPGLRAALLRIPVLRWSKRIARGGRWGDYFVDPVTGSGPDAAETLPDLRQSEEPSARS